MMQSNVETNLTSTVTSTSATKPLSRKKLLGVAGTGWMFDAMDVGILSFVIAAIGVQWGLDPTEKGCIFKKIIGWAWGDLSDSGKKD